MIFRNKLLHEKQPEPTVRFRFSTDLIRLQRPAKLDPQICSGLFRKKVYAPRKHGMEW